jgi:peroxiredoxin
MIAQLSRMGVLNIAVALVSFVALTLDAFSQTSEGTHEASPALRRPPFCVIQVETADGKPLSNAPVVCISPSTNACLKGTTIEGGSERFQTDFEGRFPLPWNDTKVVVMAANDTGFALAQSSDLVKNPTMIVRPWGRVEGRRTNRGQPVPGQLLRYRLAMSFLVGDELRGIGIIGQPVVTDSKGLFVFEHVPPVEILLSGRRKHPEKYYSALQLAQVEAGKTTRIEIATQGRTLVGHLDLDAALTNRIDFTSLHIGLQPDLDARKANLMPSIPEEFDTPEGRGKWMHVWYGTDAGRQHLELLSRLYDFEVHSDGSLVADMIEPGNYWMNADIEEKGRTVAVLCRHVEIPGAGTNAENEPFDVGKATVKPAMKAGDAAPDFSVMTLDGKPLKLTALKGKYVLLDFWATWCPPCVAETPDLKSTYDAFGKDDRFVMVSLSLDTDPAAPRKFVRNHGLPWTQAFLDGAFNNVTMHDYGFDSIPQILLIGPDGRVLATDLRGPKIREAVAAALAH